MKSYHWLLLLYVVSFLLLPYVKVSEKVENYRPQELVAGNEERGVINLFETLIKLTVLLILLKFIGFRLSWIIDVAVFMSGYMMGDLFGVGLPLGLLLLSLRKSNRVDLFNISSALTIAFFSVILSRFLSPKATMLLLTLLSLYDVVGVLYLPYIKFLWLQFSKSSFTGVAIISEDGFFLFECTLDRSIKRTGAARVIIGIIFVQTI